MGSEISVVGIVNSIYLLPLYYFSNDDESNPDQIVRLTVTGTPVGSGYMAATVVATYVIILYTMRLILKEFDWFIGTYGFDGSVLVLWAFLTLFLNTEKRNKHMMRPLPSNYT